MSTPLIILAAILGVFALVLIPLMMFRSGQQNRDQQHAHGKQVKKPHRKKKKR